MTQWNQNPSEFTFVPHEDELDLEELNNIVADTAETLEDVLKRFFLILAKLHNISKSNQTIENLLKRVLLTLIALCYVSEANLDKTLKHNFQLLSLPDEGFDELLETTSDIRDFYTYVNDDSTAITQTEIVSGRITHSFVRPEFPIIPDDEE